MAIKEPDIPQSPPSGAPSHSGMFSFLHAFGKPDANSQQVSSPISQPDTSQAPGDAAKFAEDLRASSGGQPDMAQAAGATSPSMEGVGVLNGPNSLTSEGVTVQPSIVSEGQQSTDISTPLADALLAQPNDSPSVPTSGIGSVGPEAAVQAPGVTPDMVGAIDEPQVPAEPEGSIGADTTNNKESSDGKLALRLMEEVKNELKSSSGKLEEAIEEIRNLRVKPAETSMDASVVQSAETLKQPEPVGA